MLSLLTEADDLHSQCHGVWLFPVRSGEISMYLRAGTVLFLGWSWWLSEEEVRKRRELRQEEQVGDQETQNQNYGGCGGHRGEGWVIVEAEAGG